MQGADTNRWKVDENTWNIECAHCGKIFEARRSDASYCTPKCRKQAHLAPKRLQSTLDEMDVIMARLREIADIYPASKRMFDKMGELAACATYQLGKFESREMYSGATVISIEQGRAAALYDALKRSEG